jgi:hypothetical protein
MHSDPDIDFDPEAALRLLGQPAISRVISNPASTARRTSSSWAVG